MNGTVALGLLLTGAGISEYPRAAPPDFVYPLVAAHVPAGSFGSARLISPYHLLSMPSRGVELPSVRAGWSTGYPGVAYDRRPSAYQPNQLRMPELVKQRLEVPKAVVRTNTGRGGYTPDPDLVPPPEPTPAGGPVVKVTDAKPMRDDLLAAPPPLKERFAPEPAPELETPAEDAPAAEPIPQDDVLEVEPATTDGRTPAEPTYGPGELWEVVYDIDPTTGEPTARLVKRATPLVEPEPPARKVSSAELPPWKRGEPLPNEEEGTNLWLDTLR